MRRLLGYLVALLGLFFLLLLFLRLWDIAPLSFDIAVKVFLTVLLVLLGTGLVLAVRQLFFRELPDFRRLRGQRRQSDDPTAY